MSEYKEIDGWEYEIYSDGRVWSKRTQKFLKAHKVGDGYMQVRLWHNGYGKNMFVHRLVAQAFIPNPANKAQVNHKDGDKTNNNVSNLEWATQSENQRHRYDVLMKRGHNPSTREANEACRKKVICVDTGVVYRSITEAAKANDGTQGCLSRCLLGRTNTFKGMRWRYV